MSHPFQELAERLRGEAPDLERMVQRALYAWAQVQSHSSGEREVYLDSAALNLHGFYSGLERLFELIARCGPQTHRRDFSTSASFRFTRSGTASTSWRFWHLGPQVHRSDLRMKNTPSLSSKLYDPLAVITVENSTIRLRK